MSHKLSVEAIIASVKPVLCTIDDKITPSNWDEYKIRKMLNDAFTNLSWCIASEDGYFSQVYFSPCGEYALKVNFADTVYPYFVQMARDNPDNPYLPDIFWHWDGEGWLISATLMNVMELPEFLPQELETDPDFQKFVYYPDKYSRYPFCDELEGGVGDLARCFADLRDELPELLFDLGTEGNILYRGDQFVVTDPLKP